MPTLKEYNAKLARLRSTRKMTRTMKMVAANRLRKTQEAQRNAQAFGRPVARMLASLSAGDEVLPHPLARPARPGGNALLLVISSDRGLCGGFNSSLTRHASQWLAENSGRFKSVKLAFCGRRGWLYFKNRIDAFQNYEHVMGRPAFAAARRIGGELQRLFSEGEFDEVFVAYNTTRSAMQREPVVEPFLPAEPTWRSPAETGVRDDRAPLFEPSRAEAWESLLPQYVNFRLFAAMLDSAVGEHAARMITMENATQNADKLIERFTVLRNQARQAAITGELIEIISGAEALR
jgi:F-type H+-transporting ATPase subunit gamma